WVATGASRPVHRDSASWYWTHSGTGSNSMGAPALQPTCAKLAAKQSGMKTRRQIKTGHPSEARVRAIGRTSRRIVLGAPKSTRRSASFHRTFGTSCPSFFDDVHKTHR